MATLSRIVSANITVNGTTFDPIENPMSISIIRDNELIEKQSGNTRKPSFYQGKTVKGITLTCRDVALYKACKKGAKVTDFDAEIESAIDTDGTEDVSANLTVSIGTSAIVTEAVSFESSTDGSPVEYSITVMLCRNAAGTPGTLSINGTTV